MSSFECRSLTTLTGSGSRKLSERRVNDRNSLLVRNRFAGQVISLVQRTDFETIIHAQARNDFIWPSRSFVSNDLLASDDLTRSAATVAISKKSWVNDSTSKQATNGDRVERQTNPATPNSPSVHCSLSVALCSLSPIP